MTYRLSDDGENWSGMIVDLALLISGRTCRERTTGTLPYVLIC